MNRDGSLYAAFPEIFLAAAGMILLLAGVIGGDKAAPAIGIIGVVRTDRSRRNCGSSSAAAGRHFRSAYCDDASGHQDGACYGCDAFNHMFVHDGFSRFVKLILLASAALSLMLSWSYLWQENLEKPEYTVLVLFATVGMMLMVSANDLLSLYVGLELQSLALYVLAAFRRDDAKSSESGLKYFVLGALSSGLILYGISMIYGFAGTTQFGPLVKMLGATRRRSA